MPALRTEGKVAPPCLRIMTFAPPRNPAIVGEAALQPPCAAGASLRRVGAGGAKALESAKIVASVAA